MTAHYESKKKHNWTPKLKIIIPLLIFLFYSVFTVAYAAGQSDPSVTSFKNSNVDVTIIIEFNYTNIGGAPMRTTVERSFELDTKAQAETIVNNEYEYGSTINAVFSKNEYQILTTNPFNYTGANLTKIVSFENGSNTVLRFGNFKYQNYSTTAADLHTGQKLEAVIPDATSIMNDWCRKHSATPGTVLNNSLSISYKSEFIDMLAISYSEPVTPDSNLDDGYQPTAASGFPWNAVVAGIIIVCIVIALGLTGFWDGMWDALDSSPEYYDFSQNVYENTTIVYDFGGTNSSEMWETYETAVGAGNATAEGFIEFVKAYYSAASEAIPDNPITHIYNLNQTNDAGQERNNMFSMITAFFENIMPFVVLFIIIILVVVGIVLAIRIFKWNRKVDKD